MLHIIFTEARMYLPFSSHETLIEMLKILGQSRVAVPAMLHFISTDLHEIFRKHLLSVKMPMSYIMNTATDTMGKYYLVIQFQTVENNKPVVYFYKLVPMGGDKSAEGYLRTINAALAADKEKYKVDLREHLKTYLVSMTTDGEGALVGRHQGLGVLLSKDLWGSPTRLFRHHCELLLLTNLLNFRYAFEVYDCNVLI